MSTLYPLRFEPLFRRYVWGGRRLQSFLGKQLPAGGDYAESWEVVDHGVDQSIVSAGRLQGLTLHEIVINHGRELLGVQRSLRQFPLLLKLLDCNQNLSVQVHPNDQQARQLDPPDLGKTEAWVVLHAEPGSVIYAGLKRGFDRAAFEREVHRGTTELCLHRFAPQVGDCIFIPAGTLHALGKGLIVAEIQQASDTTFRVFDWNRVGPDGKPRQLHLEAALSVIDYDAGPVSPQQPQPTERPHVRQLVACDKFVLNRWSLTHSCPIGGDDRAHIISVLEGTLQVAGDPVGQPLVKGQTILIPAELGACRLMPEEPVVLLDAYPS